MEIPWLKSTLNEFEWAEEPANLKIRQLRLSHVRNRGKKTHEGK